MKAVHISGQLNTGADDLSRDSLQLTPLHPPTQLRYHLRCRTCSSPTRQTGHHPSGGSFAAISGGRISPLHSKGVHSGLEPLPQICTHLQSRVSFCDQRDGHTFCRLSGHSRSTIESYLSALRHMRLTLAPCDPCLSLHSPQMALLLRGIRRSQVQSVPQLVRRRIMPTLMRRIKFTLARHADSYDSILLWAACCVVFLGFLRCGEFLVPDSAPFDQDTHLPLDDVSLDTSTSRWFFLLTIKASKTDQFRQWATVALGSTGTDLCPVDALLDYLGRRGNLASPLFCLETGQPLQRRSFTAQVQQALSASGVDGSLFNGHSIRLGAATSASIA